MFEAWSIEIPVSFEETFVAKDNYWHAYEDRRSVSLTSMVLTEEGEPVSAERILHQIRPEAGTPLDDLPARLGGWATTSDAPPQSRASRILSGMLAVDGRVLLATVTSDDLEWARRVWSSIRSHPVYGPSLDCRRRLRRGLPLRRRATAPASRGQ